MWTTIAALVMVVNASPAENPPGQTAGLDIRHSVLSSKSIFLPPVQQPAPGSRGWVRRHPVMFGATVGAGIGAAVAVATPEFACAGGDDSCLFSTAKGALVGAGIGAGFGALAGLIGQAVSRSPAPDLRSSALRGVSPYGVRSLQQGNWVRRHPVWLGIAVGGAAGAAWGSTQYVEGTDAIGGRGGMTLFGAGIGVGVGALGGFLVGLATK